MAQNSGICCFSGISAYGGGKMLYMEASNYAEMFANAGRENVKFGGLLLHSEICAYDVEKFGNWETPQMQDVQHLEFCAPNSFTK